MNNSTLSPEILRQAARWLVRLDDRPSSADRQAFSAWLALDPQHVHAVERLQAGLAPLRSLPRDPARAALKHVLAPSRGARMAKALLLVLGLSIPLGLAWQQYPPRYLMADLQTGSGQWRTEALPDGSQITLDGRSAVDLQFDAKTRTLHLVQGEILIQVAKDAQRPFVVQTAHGSVRALGTRFVVEQDSEGTRLAMLESSTQVQSAGQTAIVHASQQMRFDATGLKAIEPLDAGALELAWAKHQLLIDRQPLGQVLEKLARNRSGFMMYDRQELAHLEVTAVLPADDSDSALQLLARSQPIEIERFTPWVTRISLKKRL